ncbi:hypothetical protein [Devosia faecipullorum]|uniref:hypothetical protein n=1 Tax=Devosia faecipullorum TaxID=2755039 RepID=UPI00187B574D|nr:hypothetical protein [Devosia faecipullorum]MBE7733906.1 hypothetical protein [Devosia faecipullorum]
MPVRLSMIAVSTLLLAAPAIAEQTQATDIGEVFACSDLFAPDTSHARLREALGDANVETGTIYGAEGMELPATILYPDDPARSMNIIWFDEDNLAYPASIELSENQIGPGGVRIGMSIGEVEALNGQSFPLGGFWWDYGGYAYFEDGALARPDPEPACYLSLRFLPSDDLDADIDVGPVSGDVELRSDLPLLEQIDTRVTSVNVGYEWPEALAQEEH